MDNLPIIATYLRTRYEGKKHGGYDIYEDDKIIIMYDTYYPNVDVYVKIGGKKELVLLRSGHGYNQVYHPGEWEKYVNDILYPKALKAKDIKEINDKKRQDKEYESNFCKIDDSKVFSNLAQ